MLLLYDKAGLGAGGWGLKPFSCKHFHFNTLMWVWLEALSVLDPRGSRTNSDQAGPLQSFASVLGDRVSLQLSQGWRTNRQTVYMNNGVERTVNWWPHGELWLVESDGLDL